MSRTKDVLFVTLRSIKADFQTLLCFIITFNIWGFSLALTAMSKYPEAISYFKKALVLDPENDTYKSNLKIAEQKHKEATSPVSENKLYCPVSPYFLTLFIVEAPLITIYIQYNNIQSWLF